MGTWKWEPLGISSSQGQKQYTLDGSDFNAIMGYSPAGAGDCENMEAYSLTVSSKFQDELGSVAYYPEKLHGRFVLTGRGTEILSRKKELTDSTDLPDPLSRGMVVIFDHLENEN